jgi:hypothetical protein
VFASWVAGEWVQGDYFDYFDTVSRFSSCDPSTAVPYTVEVEPRRVFGTAARGTSEYLEWRMGNWSSSEDVLYMSVVLIDAYENEWELFSGKSSVIQSQATLSWGAFLHLPWRVATGPATIEVRVGPEAGEFQDFDSFGFELE